MSMIAAICGIFLFSAFALFYKLGNEPFVDYDEATYAEVTSESLAHGNYLSLTFQNTPYFRKPPLLFWLTTTSERIFPDVEFAARAPSALAGLLTIALVILICLEAGVTMPIALVAGSVLATTSTWMEFARDIRFDNLVSFFILLSLYCGMRALRNSRWYIAVSATLALAVLSKSVITVFAGVALLSFTYVELGTKQTLKLLKNPYLWGGIGVFFLVAAPWHLIQTIRYGAAFWQSYLGQEVIHRANANLFPGGSNPTNAQYLVHSLLFAAPWSELFILSLVAIPFVLRHATVRVKSTLVASLLTATSIILVMGFADTKAFGYLIPLYPFIAVTIALIVFELWRQKIDFRPVLVGAGVACTLYASLLTVYNALHNNPYYGWELGQAREEYNIGTIIHTASNPTVYEYQYDAIGSITYYSGLPSTQNPFVLVLAATSTPSKNSFVLASVPLTTLEETFPEFHFSNMYVGRFVSLFTFTR